MAEAKIKIGAAIAEYQQAMRQAAAEMKNVSSEYSLAAANAKLYGTQSDALRAKVTELTKKLELQKGIVEQNKTQQGNLTAKLEEQQKKQETLKQKVQAAKQAYEESSKATGEHSEETEKLKQEYEKLEAKLESSERAIGKTKTSITNQEAAVAQSESALKQLEAQLQDVNAELARQKFDEYAEKANKVGDAVTDAGKKMGVVTGALAGVAGASIKTTADFEAQMSKVGAISGATGEDFNKLADKAKEMGAKTKFSASESAEALEYMAMAGWKTEDMLDGIEGIMNLAAASGENLGNTSDIVTDALTAFGLTAADSGHFADVLAQASASANTNVSMLGESFKYVAPVAGTLGYSAEDTAIALGLMANAGIKGSQAGTSLRSAITNMVSPTDDMIGIMNKFGIEIQNTDGSMKPFRELMDDLREKFRITTDAEREQSYAMAEQELVAWGLEDRLKGLTEEQKKLEIERIKGLWAVEELTEKELKQQVADRLGIDLTKERTLTDEEWYKLHISMGKEELAGLTEAKQAEAAATLFGKEAMSGMLNIINASDKDYQKLTESIYGCGGAAEDMANTMLDNLSGQVTILKSAIEGVSITIGEILLPYVKEGVEWIQGIVDKFANLDEGTQRTIVKIGALVAAVSPVLLAAGKVIKFTASVSSGLGALAAGLSKTSSVGGIATTAVKGVSGAIGSLASPIGIAVAAIAVIAGAIITLWNANEDFRNAITEIWNGIKQAFTDFGQGITDRLNALGFHFEDFTEVVKAVWTEFCNFLAPIIEMVFGTISAVIQTTFDVILGTFDFFVSLFQGNWEGCWNAVKGIAESVWNGIKDYLSGILDMLKGLADVFLGWFGTSWEEVWGSIKTFFEGIWDGIVSFFTGILDAIRNAAETSWNAVYNTVSTWLNNVYETVSSIFTSCWETIQTIWETIKNVIQVAIMFIAELVHAAYEIITVPFRFIWENCKDFIMEAWEFIKAVVTDRINTVKDVVETVFNAVSTFIQEVWDGISSAVNAAWEFIKTAVEIAITAVQMTVETVFNAVSTFIQEVWDGISSAISAAWEFIKTAVEIAVTAVKTTVITIFNTVKDKVTSVWNAIKTAIMTPINVAKEAVSNTVDSIKTKVANVFDSVKSAVESKWNSIKEAISKPINTARDTVKNVIEKIKGFFNFSWSLPHLKMPHPTISGSFSLNPPSVPSFSIEWYKNGGIMTEPTVFGANGTTLFAGGEAGDEAILPLAPFYTSLSAMLDQKFEALKQTYRIQVTVVNEMDGEVIAEKTTELVSDNLAREYDRRR